MERTVARRLPEEFLELPGSPHQRALLIVYRYWAAYPETEQDDLVQTLAALLEPILQTRPPSIPDRLRDECEKAVQSWEKRAMATDRPARSSGETVVIGASPPRQLRFVSAKVTPLEGTGFGARVTLERPPGGWCVGFAQCGTESEQLRCVAEATIDALRQAVPERGLRFELEGVGTFQACGFDGVLVSLTVKHEDRSWQAIGLCAGSTHDQHGAVALAVLNGTNRLLRTG
jgi:hypothetical protein